MSMLWVSLCLAMASLLPTQANEFPPMANFQPDLFAGQWYVVAMGSNCARFMGMKSAIKMGIAMISVLDNGDLEVPIGFPMQGKCKQKDMHYHMVKPGHYTEIDNAHSDSRFVETDYTHNALELIQKVHENEEPCTIVKLLAREPEIHPAPYKRFMLLVNGIGLTEDNVAQLPHEEDCVPGTF